MTSLSSSREPVPSTSAAALSASELRELHPHVAAWDPPLQLLGGALSDDPAVVENRDPVGEMVRLVQILGRQKDRDPVGDQLADAVPHRAAAAGIEPGRRLVEKDHLRRADERHRQIQPAAHAARVGRHRAPGGVDELEPFKQLGDPRRSSGAAEVVQIGHQPQVLLAGQQLVHRRELPGHPDRRTHPVRIGVHIVAGDARLAGVGWDQGGQDPHDRRLAGAVRAQQSEHGALGDGQLDAVEHRSPAKGLATVLRR